MLEYKRSAMKNAIEEHVANPNYRKLLTLKLCEGYTYEAAAEAANYSTQHAKRLCKKYKPFLMSLL